MDVQEAAVVKPLVCAIRRGASRRRRIIVPACAESGQQLVMTVHTYGEVGSVKIVQIRYKFFPLVQVPLLAGSHAPWAPHA